MRLVATDLDGTLLRRDRTVSPRTAAVLRRLSARGVHVALVTGRPVRWLAAVYEQLGSRPPSICANGAVVYDPENDRVLRADPLAPELITEVSRRVRAAIPGVGFAVEIADGREMRHERTYEVLAGHEPDLVRALVSAEELCALPAVKLLARVDTDPATFPARVTACLGGLAEATYSSDSGLVEISAAGITKAAGLAWLCDRLGVPAADVVAFGDMPNDIPMLAWAGRAVAVANAHPAVCEVADEMTLSNDDDGVAAYLDKLMPDRPAGGAAGRTVGRPALRGQRSGRAQRY
jgi:hydroxymethylpyrimidine pyrophosphatase-like HAD family hydrolase